MNTKQALVDAVCYDALDDLRRVLNRTRDAEAVATALQLAIEYGRSRAVDIILAAAPGNVELRASYGMTPLMWASKTGRLELVRKLLDAGANPNATDVVGWPPLFYAARHQHLRVVRELIDWGADLQHRDVEGHSALDVATDDPSPRGPFLPGARRRFVETSVAKYLRLRLDRLTKPRQSTETP